MINTPLGQQQAPTPAYFMCGTWKPCIAPSSKDSLLKSKPMVVQAWEARKSKGQIVMVWIRVGILLGTKVSPRLAGLLS